MKVNVFDLTFTENCGNLRESKVIDIIRELQSYGLAVLITDPQADFAVNPEWHSPWWPTIYGACELVHLAGPEQPCDS